ncbi:MAG: BamA/TamA family outer membrane protein [Krumholzibacteria bacterium]|nr:BamA/TamA family outer membrane protein [Candidatus Krumholzibacteria bacterium]
MAACACLAQPVPAQDEAAAWRRYNGWEVSAFAVEGVPADLGDELAAGLWLAGRPRFLRGAARPPFDAGSLVQDLRRTQLFLAARGYPAAAVRARLEPDDRARRVAVRLDIAPGRPVLVSAVRVSGWPEAVPAPAVADPRLTREGERFTDQGSERAMNHLAALLQDAGYARVKVERRLERVGPEAVAVEYVVTPGDPYVVTSVTIGGCSDDLLPVARRVLDVRPPVAYDRTLLADGAVDLRATQLFSRVELTTEPTGPGELALHASLANGRMRALSASVGTWSDNPWMVQAGWLHRNLFEGGRGLRVGGVYATHEQRFGAEVFRLGWLAPRAVTSLGGEWLREDEDAYRSNEYTARLLQSFRPRGRGLWQVGVSVSNVDVVTYSPDAEDLPEAQEWLLEFYVDRKWDWTDDVLYPTGGGYTKVALTWAPAAAFFGASYVQAQLDGAAYRGLGPLGLGAARLRLGWSQPLGENPDLLPNRRFYAGGYNTMRGYARRDLGPRDADGNPRGGQATVLGGAELRRRLVWIFDAAVFLDAGDVWRRPSDAALKFVRAAWGADLDVRTPLGPLRIGYAWNIGPVLPGEPDELWHFGIGYPW